MTMGLCAALQQKGVTIQPFKKGPDYIDPMWLSRAAQIPCRNLDFFTMSHQQIINFFYQFTQNVDVAFIEGNKGLFDGLDPGGSDSNSALARLLGVPEGPAKDIALHYYRSEYPKHPYYSSRCHPGGPLDGGLVNSTWQFL